MKKTLLAALLLLPLAAQAQTPRPTPLVDFHQHLFSPAAAALVGGSSKWAGIDARELIALLDSAGIQHALVLSMAYTWASASRPPVENEYEHVKAENDWTSAQVAQYPDRLRGFCSFNPLRDYALAELARCAKDPHLHYGLKLHFGNSDVDLDNPQNVQLVRKVLRAANGYHMPIVVHMHASISKRRNYGSTEARVFLNELLPAASDVPVQIAHLGGAGDYGDTTDVVLGVFIDALKRSDARMKNVWFDVTTVVRRSTSAEKAQRIAERIREIGVARVLFGSDAYAPPNLAPREAWAAFRNLPLTEAEFRIIASNVTPYMRW